MIVFNMLAIPVAILIAIVYGVLLWLMPDFMGGAYGDLVLAGAAFAIGAICEILGLKGRLFWLPVWFLGLAGGVYQAYVLWGWLGLAVGAAALVLAVFALIMFAKRQSEAAWRAAPEALMQAQAAVNAGNRDAAWAFLKDAFCTTFWDKYDQTQSKHNLQTLALLRQLTGENLPPSHLNYLNDVSQRFQTGTASQEPIELPTGMAEWIETLIEGTGTTEEEPPKLDE